MQIDEHVEEVADAKTPRNFTRANCQKIAAGYQRARAAGKITKPLSLFLARILHHAAVSDTDR